jgi:hypothetical protein
MTTSSAGPHHIANRCTAGLAVFTADIRASSPLFEFAPAQFFRTPEDDRAAAKGFAAQAV